jgi:hypothetical protein
MRRAATPTGPGTFGASRGGNSSQPGTSSR